MENKTKNEKIFEMVLMVLGILCGMGVIIFGALFLAEKMENGLEIAEILLGVLMLVQGLQNLKKSKLTAIVSFVAAALIVAAACVTMFA